MVEDLANYLAKAGMKVLLIEQHDKPGGYCTSFKRRGFTFDAAAHSFGSYREGGNFRKIIHELGVDTLEDLHQRADPSFADQGDRARKEVSMAKVHVADALHNAADVAIQLNGARGYSKDTILEWVYRYARSARLVDGASEVHKMVLARFMREEGRDFWKWG